MLEIDQDSAHEMLKTDARIPVLIEWLMARYEPLDFEYKVAVTFALGYMMKAYEWDLENQGYYR